MESKAAMELSRFAKPMVPSGMRFEHATFLGPGRVISSSSAASYRLHRPCWFRGREARCSSAKRETLVQIQSEPPHAEMAELAMHFLAKEDHAGLTPVLRSISFAPLA